MNESALKRAVIRRLEQLKASGVPLHWLKVAGSAMQRSGEPDITVCIFGHMVLLELKTVKGKVTRLQQHRMSQWTKAGARCVVIRSVSDLEIALADFLTIHRIPC